MAEAGQKNSNGLASRQPKKTGLNEALLRLIPEIPYYKSVIPGRRTYVVHPHLPISQVFWDRRELAIQQLDAAIYDGDLMMFAFNEKTGELVQILTSRWREHQRGRHREMIISGVVKASAGDAELWIGYRDEDCRLVLLADDFDAWLERRAGKWAASIPVKATSASSTADESSARSAQPDSSTTTPVAETTELMREDPENKGARRGPKVKYDWPVFQAEFFVRLSDDDIGLHDKINIAQRASDLMTWGQRHFGDGKTPEDSAMREKVSEWIEIWRRKPKT